MCVLKWWCSIVVGSAVWQVWSCQWARSDILFPKSGDPVPPIVTNKNKLWTYHTDMACVFKKRWYHFWRKTYLSSASFRYWNHFESTWALYWAFTKHGQLAPPCGKIENRHNHWCNQLDWRRGGSHPDEVLVWLLRLLPTSKCTRGWGLIPYFISWSYFHLSALVYVCVDRWITRFSQGRGRDGGLPARWGGAHMHFHPSWPRSIIQWNDVSTHNWAGQ